MFRPLTRSHRRPHRRGTSFVLIVVVMISLAASVGVAFALLAGQTLRISAANKQAAGAGGNPPARAPEPTSIVNQFLSSLIFDTNDDSNSDLTNALRGNSMARSMYGYDHWNLSNPLPSGAPRLWTTPWAGVGTFIQGNGYGDRSKQINYTQVRVGGSAQPVLLDPEYMGQRNITPVAGSNPPTYTRPAFSTGGAGAYVGKHAGYSFPDLKDFFLAAVDPATGQVLMPSFHRPWLWNSQYTDNTTSPPSQKTYTLDPGNPHWNDAPGSLMTLRPRPLEHPRFPRVPTNADGSTTGDVQNWPGGYTFGPDPAVPGTNRYFGRNDSLWMHIGLPPVQFGNRMVQPLVAPLIVPLDGLFNASVHGNTFSATGNHISQSGWGPWEVNMSAAGGTLLAVNEAQNVVNTRGTPGGNLAFNPYSPGPAPGAGTGLPSYAPVAWSGAGAGPVRYPTNASITGQAAFPGFQTNNAPVNNHPALFNPAVVGSSGSPRTYPASDIKRMQLRYAFMPDWYAASDIAPLAPVGLLATNMPFVYSNGQNTANSYRLDTAHTNHNLITTRSFALDRPKLTPSIANTSGLQMGDGTVLAGVQFGPLGPFKPGFVNPTGGTPQGYPAPGPRGTITDFADDTRWVSAVASLGSVNLNRALADYRGNPNGNTTLTQDTGNTQLADADRRQLAQDIFVRLAAATGAALQVNPGNLLQPYNILAKPNTSQFDALRYLAQLSANIVDYIDNDDVSTVFEWNPVTPKYMSDPLDPANFAGGQMNNSVVFGVEKPRLVINEAYAEITNDPNDKNVDPDPTGNPQPLKNGAMAHVRFWLELLNPAETGVAGTPIGNGTVHLTNGGNPVYQIQIARYNQVTGAMGTPGSTLDITNPTAVLNNVTGQFNGGADVTYSFPPPGPAAAIQNVLPNNGQFNPNQNQLSRHGIVLVAANDIGKEKPKPSEFTPQGGAWTAPLSTLKASNLFYTIPMPDINNNAVTTVNSQEFRRHIVLLRRLANPYSPPGPTNPYITVDMMDYVPAFDAVARFVNQAQPRMASQKQGDQGYDPLTSRYSVGKVQPLAGLSFATIQAQPQQYNKYVFPSSMVLNQQTPDPTMGANSINSTFGRQNYVTQPKTSTVIVPAGATTPTLQNGGQAETLMVPFDWMPHMDRPLINSLELMPCRDSASHLVTPLFVQQVPTGAGPQLLYETGTAGWRYLENGIARGLEMLTVKPYINGVPHGGRIPGQINLNGINDKRVLEGLFDRQGGNSFNAAFVNNVWTGWMATRNGVTTRQLASGGAPENTTGNSSTLVIASGATVPYDPPGQSLYDGTGGTVWPFLPLGGAAGNGTSTFAYAKVQGIDDTFLRRPAGGTTIDVRPMVFNSAAAGGAGNLYDVQEPMRKIYNNITTVNHSYMVILTIGYFEIDTVTPSPTTGVPDGILDLGAGISMPRLAQEAFLSVPGDMRQKYIAVIDMSNMAIDPSTNGPSASPFFTTLTQTVRPALNAMGQIDPTQPVTVNINPNAAAPINANSKLVLGYGSEEQVVTVTSVAGGQLTVTGVTRPAWAGSSVSNARPGFPGVQGSGFSFTDPKYKPVVPFIQRLQ
jgi:hypothetical protein